MIEESLTLRDSCSSFLKDSFSPTDFARPPTGSAEGGLETSDGAEGVISSGFLLVRFVGPSVII